jgi:hypothetical protein
MRNRYSALIYLALLLAGGCSSTVHFSIIVTNRLSEPVTVWLTKSQGPYEDGWVPPELVAARSSSADVHVGGVIVPPGQSRSSKITGTFSGNNRGVLRIYRAQTLDAILAIDRGSTDRVDYSLPAGQTDIDVVNDNGQLAVTPHNPPHPPLP